MAKKRKMLRWTQSITYKGMYSKYYLNITNVRQYNDPLCTQKIHTVQKTFYKYILSGNTAEQNMQRTTRAQDIYVDRTH